MLKSQSLQKKSNQLETSITKEYDLCNFCLGRLLSKKYNSTSYKILGKKLRKNLSLRKSKKCYICKNLFDNLDSYFELLVSKSSNYQFKTFVLGTIIKPSLSERDDLIKSKFQIRGIDSLKTNVTKELSRRFSRKTRSKIINLDPELTLTVNFKTMSCDLRTKPVYFYCRYTKTKRGLVQKQKVCEDCSGKGCFLCENHGITEFNSVEGKISNFLYKKFHADRVKINWIGGEDRLSLVLGKGRPIFVKIINPSKRNIRLPNKIKLGEIVLYNLKIIKEYPNGSKPFRSSVLINIETKDKINSEDLKKIKKIKNKQISIFERNGKINKKSIYSINYKKNGINSFVTSILVDGGFPIKRFVEGNGVLPNISDILKNESKCKQFDFKQIYLST